MLFDEQAAAIFGSIDVLAERVRRLGGTTIRSIGHISRLQNIQDDDDDFVPPDEMIQRLIADNQQMARRQREAIELCEQNRDTPPATSCKICSIKQRSGFGFCSRSGLGTTWSSRFHD